MAESHVITGLVAKRSEVGGLIAHYQQEITRLQNDLQHLDATIKLFDPEYDLRTIRSKPVRQRNKYFAHGEGHRLMLEALRKLGGQASTVQVALAVLTRKGINAEHQSGVHHCLDGVLRRAASSGVVTVVGRDETGIIWKLADLPQ
ncbi:hypothetical protein [Paludibacterium denitrificans]|uniref:Uncharacterized protein n=1 Tax=Paludibacterium denitrificans TaxID=2675226 RepID=A0A844GDW3_9NEIS|nr:hypothetical protein [Paludibacterium denitrificans]MTD33408.1 hypothetical protein [Paludibacterium denitrificans]